MTRYDRLEALMNRAYRRRRRRRALQLIAQGFGRHDRVVLWTRMHAEAERLAEALWAEWKNTAWEATRATQTPGFIVRHGNAHPLPKRPS